MNVETGIKIVEEIVVGVQVFGVGIAQHHAYAPFMEFAEKGGEFYLLLIIEPGAAVCCEMGRFAYWPVGRVEIDK